MAVPAVSYMSAWATQGHEVVGIVTEVGKNVTNFKLGDHAGVGCFVDACRDCRECSMEIDNYCTRCIMTYNGKDWRHGNKSTAGGYSTGIVVDHRLLPCAERLYMRGPFLCTLVTTACYLPAQVLEFSPVSWLQSY